MTREKILRTYAICVLSLVGLGAIGGAGYLYLQFRVDDQIRNCNGQLRKLYDVALKADRTLIQSKAALLAANNNHSIDCSGCGQAFEYRPIAGKVNMDGESVEGVTMYRMIAWCPEPSHKNGRVVLFENGDRDWLPEAYFQECVERSYYGEFRRDAVDGGVAY